MFWTFEGLKIWFEYILENDVIPSYNLFHDDDDDSIIVLKGVILSGGWTPDRCPVVKIAVMSTFRFFFILVKLIFSCGVRVKFSFLKRVMLIVHIVTRFDFPSSHFEQFLGFWLATCHIEFLFFVCFWRIYFSPVLSDH